MDTKVRESNHAGQPVDCTDEQYRSGVRDELQRAAGEYINAGDGLRAMIALAEVKRLDAKFRVA